MNRKVIDSCLNELWETKSNQEWAQAVKNHVYNLENNPNFEFGEKDN